jgi:O-antigen ligase
MARFLRETPRGLLALVAASCALPLIQLIPLPPGLWTGLPGQGPVREAFALSGHEGDRKGLSVAALPTFVAFLGTLAPLAIVALGWRLAPRELGVLHRWAVLTGLVCAGFGMVLVAAGNATGIYPEPPQAGVLFATFANRNSAALFFVCSLLLLVCLPVRRPLPKGELALRSVGALILVLGVLLTQSRSGIALLVLPALLGGARLLAESLGARTRLIAAGALAATVIVGGAVLVQSTRVETSLSRFDDLEDMRPAMWEDGVSVARQYWPLGAGMGTFDDVFQIGESLEYVSPRRAGRAHNDYIEVAIEAGLPGLVLIAGWLIWIASASWRAWRRRAGWPAAGAASVLAAVALQSIVDYPLRNEAMACLAAFAVLLLARASPGAHAPEPEGSAA